MTAANVTGMAENGNGAASPYVKASVAILEEIGALLGPARKLVLACDEWLRHPTKRDCYDVGPRAEEVTVTYRDGDQVRQASLAALLAEVRSGGKAVIGVESSIADPRRLIVDAMEEARRLLDTADKISARLTSAQDMIRLREVILGALAEADPEIARQVAALVERRIILAGFFGGAGALPAGKAACTGAE